MAALASPHRVGLGPIPTVHLVYVHGFRGDHTTFQAFPSDLHNHLLPDIPGLQTWVYPTYKSAKPLSFAVRNLLAWLKSIPDGSIILAGHSMGGLLVAEAATDPSPVARRIIGVLAFDTPYLGMHPHVVVSGIASLLPKKEDADTAAKNKENKEENIDGDNPGPPRAICRRSLSSLTIAVSRIRIPESSQQRCLGRWFSFLSNVTSFFTKYADDPFVRFLNKHSDAPIAAMSRWVVEYFEFGWAMFDYPELLDRYERLEKWEGDWVCFWTVTGGKELEEDTGMGEEERPPTPTKIKRLAIPGEFLENEFEMAMRTAKEKEEKRRSKEVGKKAKKEEKERAEREKSQRKDEEAQEKQRKKEEEVQEKERKKATEALEKETKKVAAAKEKEMKAKEDAEKKEQARIAKAEGKRTRDAAKAAKKGHTEEVGADQHSHESEPSTANPPNPPSDSTQGSTSTPHGPPPPEVVVEGADPSILDAEEEQSDKDNHSVTNSFKTALETHIPESGTRSPAHSLTPSHSQFASRSRPPSPRSASAHHFITLPGKHHPRRKNHWLKVRISGVQDEVAAHCGLFIPAQNLEYDRFVERVGGVVKSWVI